MENWGEWSGFSDFGGGASDPGFNMDLGSWSQPDYADFAPPTFNTGTPDVLGSQGMYQNSPGPEDMYQQAGSANGLMGGLGNFLSDPKNLQGLLGTGGSLASIIGALVQGGKGATTQPTVNNRAQGSMDSANSQLGAGAAGNLPLQQMQMSLLQALASGQGLPPGYAQLIEQAFQPQMGDLYSQAAKQGQTRGFHDAPATSPPGGAILGPGLANIQGQMAAAKLGLMQSLPGMFQNPINSQIGAQQGAATNLMNTARTGMGQTTTTPIAGQIGNAIGSGLQGLGQSFGPQDTFQQALQQLQKSGMGISLSGARN